MGTGFCEISVLQEEQDSLPQTNRRLRSDCDELKYVLHRVSAATFLSGTPARHAQNGKLGRMEKARNPSREPRRA